ncbi:MAG TPA: CAP domain-containing protein [Kofleriaceae bacterium]|nr:CAP domain-containing protein [Kofleriaceae bacterium]
MKTTRSRLFTLLCILAMLIGLAAAAWAQSAPLEQPAQPELDPETSFSDRLSSPIDFDAVDESLLAAAIFLATNQRRAEQDLAPLRHAPRLSRMAARHARRMVEQGFYAHDDPFERALARPVDRARAAGIANPMVAENIHDYRALRSSGGAVYVLGGRGRFSLEPDGPAIPPHTYWSFAQSVVDEWMESSGHRHNILDPNARQLGVGVRFYWRDGGWPFIKAVQNFQLFEDVVGVKRLQARVREGAGSAA